MFDDLGRSYFKQLNLLHCCDNGDEKIKNGRRGFNRAGVRREARSLDPRQWETSKIIPAQGIEFRDQLNNS
jgi:hypothetical protein